MRTLVVALAAVSCAASPVWAQGGRDYPEKGIQADSSNINKSLDKVGKDFKKFKDGGDLKSWESARGSLFKVKDEVDKLCKRVGAEKAKTHPKVVEVVKRYDETWKLGYVECEANLAKLVEAVEAPVDAYKGEDKAKLVEMIEKEWKRVHPKDEILGIRMVSDKWERTKLRRWNDAVNEWQYSDNEALLASVVVKTSEKIATIYPAFINKDKLAGDALNAGVETKSNEYIIRDMLVSKFK